MTKLHKYMPSRKRFFNRFKLLFQWLLILILLGIASLAAVFVYVARDLPDPETIITRQVSESTKIYDRTGQTILYNIHGEEKRTIIAWENIPENIKSATLVSEDADFYSHQGLDFSGITRAFLKNLLNFKITQGGSTITQQLIKKALLGDERTLTRKIKEAILSIEIERRFTKDQIFWMYLNQIPYGSNAYGIEAASQTFFGKNTKDLSWAQAVLLASLPKAPSYYSPYGSHLSEILARKDHLLRRLQDLDYISEETYQTALKEKLEFEPVREGIIAPHFVMMVRDYLVKKYGEDLVESGGLQVYTTLDTDLQKIGEETVTKYAEINQKRYKAGNAALVAVNPRNGQILTMVGSKDYFDIENEGNFNVALARRQPGSAFKPFAYAAALDLGYPDTTILFDYKTEFNPDCSPDSLQVKDENGFDCYHPQNYDLRFRGPVTMRQSLAQSLNLPSVEILYLAGLNRTMDLATRLGISTLEERSNFGLSLVLGGAEVKLLDITAAYAVFANDGLRAYSSFILKVADGEGNILEEYKPKEERALDSQVARGITSILSDNRARSSVFGPNSSLYFPDRPVAAKTGTTQENRDAWVLGYTPSLSVGVWTGNNDNTPMTREGAGISAAGPLWHEFLSQALKNQPIEEFFAPDPAEVAKVMLDGTYVYRHQSDDGAEKTEVHNILHYVNKNDPRGDMPSNPYSDPQYQNWEYPVQLNNYSLLPQITPEREL